MWISKKRWESLEKRIAHLEVQVQSQLKVKIDINTICQYLHRHAANHGSGAEEHPTITSVIRETLKRGRV